MTTATLPPASPSAYPALVGLLNYVKPGQRLVLCGATFADYEQLVAARTAAGRRGVKIAYDDGVMEIMVVSGTHERLKQLVALLIEAWIEESGGEYLPSGGMTHKRSDLEKGLRAGRVLLHPELASCGRRPRHRLHPRPAAGPARRDRGQPVGVRPLPAVRGVPHSRSVAVRRHPASAVPPSGRRNLSGSRREPRPPDVVARRVASVPEPGDRSDDGFRHDQPAVPGVGAVAPRPPRDSSFRSRGSHSCPTSRTPPTTGRRCWPRSGPRPSKTCSPPCRPSCASSGCSPSRRRCPRWNCNSTSRRSRPRTRPPATSSASSAAGRTTTSSRACRGRGRGPRRVLHRVHPVPGRGQRKARCKPSSSTRR